MRPLTKDTIDRYVEKGIEPGGFLTAVFENNLFEAVARADSLSIAELPEIVKYIYNNCPIGCWGSREAFQSWMKSKK
jgi:hypothetical protein